MSCYGENRPVIVERAEGREVIDVDGHRYLDAISSLWVTTSATGSPSWTRRCGTSSTGSPTPRCWATATPSSSSWPRRSPPGPGRRPRFLFASDGAAAVEQALKIAFQYWTNQGVTDRTRYLAFGGAYHGDTIGSLAVGDGGFGTDVFDPLRFPVLRSPSLGEPGAVDTAVAQLREHGPHLAAVVLEPLVQGAAGMAPAPARGGASGSPPPRPSTTSCSSATRSPPASAAPAPCSPPSRSAPAPTCSSSARASPAATCRCRRPLRTAGSGRRSSAPTSRSGPSTTGTPTAGTPSPPPSRSATSTCSTSGTSSPT